MKTQLKKNIPSNVKTCIICEGTNLLIQFPIKDRTKFEHRNSVVYVNHCPNVTCNEIYAREVL